MSSARGSWRPRDWAWRAAAALALLPLILFFVALVFFGLAIGTPCPDPLFDHLDADDPHCPAKP